MMKKTFITALSILIVLAINSNAQQHFTNVDSTDSKAESENLSDIEWIEKATDITVENNNVPSIVVGLIEGNKVKKVISRGYLNRNSRLKVNKKTLWQIGSLAKTFTAIIANNLILEGKIDINKSIVDYLPKTFPMKRE